MAVPAAAQAHHSPSKRLRAVGEGIGLSFAEIADGQPPIAYRPMETLRVILGDELRAGRVLERDGLYTLGDGWPAEQREALRGLVLV